MAEILDQKSLTLYRKALAKSPKKSGSKVFKPVSKEQAMRQILRFSKVPRRNVYSSMQLTGEGKLILKDSPKK